MDISSCTLPPPAQLRNFSQRRCQEAIIPCWWTPSPRWETVKPVMLWLWKTIERGYHLMWKGGGRRPAWTSSNDAPFWTYCTLFCGGDRIWGSAPQAKTSGSPECGVHHVELVLKKQYKSVSYAIHINALSGLMSGLGLFLEIPLFCS
jgi:hypothetical protein